MNGRVVGCWFTVVALLSPLTGLGQGNDWDAYKTRTFKEIIALDADVNDRPTKDGDLVIHADSLPSRVRVTYTGTARPLPEWRKDLIYLWAQSTGIDTANLKYYQKEYLFLEGRDQYWVPVREGFLVDFEKELTKGGPVDLYLLRVGGKRVNGQWEWIFLLNDFQRVAQVGAEQCVPPEPAQPSSWVTIGAVAPAR